MKKIIVLFICAFASIVVKGQTIFGAWETYHTSENGAQLKSVAIVSDAYYVLTTYNVATGKFVNSNGGSWKLEGDLITQKIAFHTDDSELVGKELSFKVAISNDVLKIVDNNLQFNRIDSGAPGKLQGAWLMSGRVMDGKTQLRDTSGPRKTMKILSGTRFQWIAYNTETKQFMGTGGGTYTTIDGEYTENIEFFSKDDSKVGLSLKFNFELKDGKWHHSGSSSKGDPIHEIWSVRD